MADFDRSLASIRINLQQLSPRLVTKVLRPSMRRGTNIVRNQARANFGTGDGPNSISGVLRASIRVVSRRGTPTRVAFSVVAGDLTAAQQKRFGLKAAFYALMVEKGHWVNTGKALGGNRKDEARARRMAAGENEHVAAHPYMRPAIEMTASAVVDSVASDVRSQIREALT
jgi:hypothetical protein